jgi:hypothetical protein
MSPYTSNASDSQTVLHPLCLSWRARASRVGFPTRFLPLPVNRLFVPPITVEYRQISTVKTGKNDIIKNHANQHLIIENQYFSNAE